MYDRVVDGKELTFGVSGKLWKNVLIIYDRQTDSLWSHLTAEAVSGPMKGKRLEVLPAVMLTYGEWKRLHPDSKILKKGSGGVLGLFRSSRDPYEGYYYSSRTGILPEKHRDSRLHPKTFIIGVALDPPGGAGGGKPAAKAYPFADLNRAGVVNDRFAGRELVVTYCEGAKSGAVFDRRAGGRTLRFSPEAPGDERGQGKAASCRYMKDAETGSRWFRLTGRAVAGPLKGTRLKQMKSTQSFWFGWKDYYPHSLIYRHSN